jgi:hypothetical protein
MALSPQQRASLLQAKLRALIIEHWNVDANALVSHPFPAGAAFVAATTGVGWVFIADTSVNADPADGHAPGPSLPAGWLGGAVVWRARLGLATLNVLADRTDSASARRNDLLASPLSLFVVNGRATSPMVAEPFMTPSPPDAVTMLLADTITECGADAVVEHGVLRGEVLGLEVARVIVDDDGVPTLEVGVGRHDRLAQSMMHGVGSGGDVAVGLREAVAAVRAHRSPDRGLHPANQLSRERWLREIVCRTPSIVGARALAPISSTVEPKLKLASPAVAVGTHGDGSSLAVGCTVGVDLDAALVLRDSVPTGVDAVLAIPTGDDVPAVRLVAGALREPVAVLTVGREWMAS